VALGHLRRRAEKAPTRGDASISGSKQTKQTEQGEYNVDGRPTPDGLQLGDMLDDEDRERLAQHLEPPEEE